MTVLGFALIVIGVALVFAGLRFWSGASRIDPAGVDGPDEFRAILDALDEEDSRTPGENRDWSNAREALN